MPFIEKKCFQSWSDLRLHFTQKCVTSNFPLLPQRPFYSRVLQSLPTESLKGFLRSNMTLLLLFFVRCTDRVDDPFASVCFFWKIILFWVVSLFLCLSAICFLCCVVHDFCLHIIPCACPNWRTSSFLDYCLQSVIFISLLSLEL